jgi:dihydroxyacetone kinase-like predicted kinase
MRDEGFGFETMFLARAEPDKPLDVDAIRAYYESIGESVLVAGDARAIKVHVHNALEDHDREPRPADRGRPREPGRRVRE